jgi:anti-sigma regulatory factor (Ser/Thr protein kinase)
MAAPSREIALDLPREHGAATIARRRLRQDLGGLLPPQELCDLTVVVSELVTNAVIHGEGAIRLRVEFCSGVLKGEVSDEGCGFECRARDVGVDQLHVRGLLFVDRFASRWGVHEGTGVVWFQMPVGERAARRSLAAY